jgi:hypothetical protein
MSDALTPGIAPNNLDREVISMSVKSTVRTIYPGVQAFDFEVSLSPDSLKTTAAKVEDEEKIEIDKSAARRIAGILRSGGYEAEAMQVMGCQDGDKAESDEAVSSTK